MFLAHCPRCDADVLLGYRSVRAVTNTPIGIEVRLRCRCGYEVETLTGVTAPEPALRCA